MITFLILRYKEVCKPGYPFDGSSSSGTGHFTQVVWKKSTELGIGMAKGKSKSGMFCTYVVGRYRPPGNYRRQYKDNVVKGDFKKDICSKLRKMIKGISNGGILFDFFLFALFAFVNLLTMNPSERSTQA